MAETNAIVVPESTAIILGGPSASWHFNVHRLAQENGLPVCWVEHAPVPAIMAATNLGMRAIFNAGYLTTEDLEYLITCGRWGLMVLVVPADLDSTRQKLIEGLKALSVMVIDDSSKFASLLAKDFEQLGRTSSGAWSSD